MAEGAKSPDESSGSGIGRGMGCCTAGCDPSAVAMRLALTRSRAPARMASVAAGAPDGPFGSCGSGGICAPVKSGSGAADAPELAANAR
jgi:hypothetical protein